MMRRLAIAIVLFTALQAAAQTPAPVPPPPQPDPPPAQESAPPPPKPAKHSGPSKWFAGGGFGLAFGTVDYITVAPMIGYHVIPRFDVGTQLYYSWVDDGRYSPSVETNDYGATLFARFRVFRQFFLEADYQYTNYEYVTGIGTTDRANYDAFLAGGGYGIPIGGRASFYVSALYDFSYNDNDVFLPYDSPWRIQVGAMVGF